MLVSIPFKRESLSKEIRTVRELVRKMFQFPSNGKAYPKRKSSYNPPPRQQVSIPFKRESLSKGKHSQLE